MKRVVLVRRNEEKSRESSIELFRVLSMIIIVAHHYVVNSGLMESINMQARLELRDYFLLVFGWGGKTGINCFVLITGFFMCKSTITWKKWLKLLGEVEFYKIIIFFCFCIAGFEAFSLTTFVKAIFPFFSIADGFTSCFLLFYLFIPFLNKLVNAITEREHFSLMVLLLTIYTILPSFVKTHVTFNYITWFCVIYILASYIRLYPKKIFENRRLWGIFLLVSLVLSWLSVIELAYTSRKLGAHVASSYFFVSDSNKILALSTSICGFLFFKNLKIPLNQGINLIASSTFGVLLIHANSDAMRGWLWQDVFQNVRFYNSQYLIIHAFGAVLLIYIICTLIDMIRVRLIEKPVAKLLAQYKE
ncbi:hypothetical protein M2149_000376 [Lachnospiraceae bacterium PFB1-21]